MYIYKEIFKSFTIFHFFIISQQYLSYVTHLYQSCNTHDKFKKKKKEYRHDSYKYVDFLQEYIIW